MARFQNILPSVEAGNQEKNERTTSESSVWDEYVIPQHVGTTFEESVDLFCKYLVFPFAAFGALPFVVSCSDYFPSMGLPVTTAVLFITGIIFLTLLALSLSASNSRHNFGGQR